MYKFDRPTTFDYDSDPECVISSFQDDALTAAKSIVELFEKAKNVSENVNKGLSDCMKLMELSPNTQLSPCVHKMRATKGYHVDVRINADIEPPRIELPTSEDQVPQNVVVACKKLNEVVRLSCEFIADEKHGQRQRNMFFVKQFRCNDHYSRMAVAELEHFDKFIGSVKQQAEYFRSDFLNL